MIEEPVREDFYALHAREKFNLPVDWQIYRWEAKSHDTKDAYLIVTGAVCTEVYKSGKYKGTKNWDKRDRSTEAVVSLRLDEHRDWLLQWERRTGKCSECCGSGQSWRGWHHIKGNTFKPCKRCDATGRAPSMNEVAA